MHLEKKRKKKVRKNFIEIFLQQKNFDKIHRKQKASSFAGIAYLRFFIYVRNFILKLTLKYMLIDVIPISYQSFINLSGSKTRSNLGQVLFGTERKDST